MNRNPQDIRMPSVFLRGGLAVVLLAGVSCARADAASDLASAMAKLEALPAYRVTLHYEFPQVVSAQFDLARHRIAGAAAAR